MSWQNKPSETLNMPMGVLIQSHLTAAPPSYKEVMELSFISGKWKGVVDIPDGETIKILG